MNIINSNNIEKWLFDYFEGNLSLHEKIELETYVANNPQYQEDFDSWEGAILPNHSAIYTNADNLIKAGIWFGFKRYAFLLLLLTIGAGV